MVEGVALSGEVTGAAAKSVERDSLAFLPGVAEQLGYYVYALFDPRDDVLFYVGKGVGGRVFQHAREARTVDGESSAGLKLDLIRAIQRDGLEVRVELVRHLLSEPEAFEVEAAVIDALSLLGMTLTNKVKGQHTERGWRPLDEIMSGYAAEPVEIASEHRVVLIRVNKIFRHGMSPDELYETTRKWWRASPERRKPEWAFSVYNGIVRAIYHIDEWERREDGRWAFRGSLDEAMETVYFWKDVSAYLPRGAQNPLAYRNC